MGQAYSIPGPRGNNVIKTNVAPVSPYGTYRLVGESCHRKNDVMGKSTAGTGAPLRHSRSLENLECRDLTITEKSGQEQRWARWRKSILGMCKAWTKAASRRPVWPEHRGWRKCAGNRGWGTCRGQTPHPRWPQWGVWSSFLSHRDPTEGLEPRMGRQKSRFVLWKDQSKGMFFFPHKERSYQIFSCLSHPHGNSERIP